MTPENDYSIEYVSPGIVRAGYHDMTDFCLIYHDKQTKIYFNVQGVLVQPVPGESASDGREQIAYVVRIPELLCNDKMNPDQLAQRNIILARLKDYITKDEWIKLCHQPISIEK